MFQVVKEFAKGLNRFIIVPHCELGDFSLVQAFLSGTSILFTMFILMSS